MISITVKTPALVSQGSSESVLVAQLDEATATVLSLKSFIHANHPSQPHPTKQRLVCAGKMLTDNLVCLADCLLLVDGTAVVHLVISGSAPIPKKEMALASPAVEIQPRSSQSSSSSQNGTVCPGDKPMSDESVAASSGSKLMDWKQDDLHLQMTQMVNQFNSDYASSTDAIASYAQLPRPTVVLINGKPHLLQMMPPSISTSFSAPPLPSFTTFHPSLVSSSQNLMAMPTATLSSDTASSVTATHPNTPMSAAVMDMLSTTPSLLASRSAANTAAPAGPNAPLPRSTQPQIPTSTSSSSHSVQQPNGSVQQPPVPAPGVGGPGAVAPVVPAAVVAAAQAPDAGAAPNAGGIAGGIAGNVMGLLNHFFQEDPDDEFGDAEALIAAQEAQEANGGGGNIMGRRRYENPIVLLVKLVILVGMLTRGGVSKRTYIIFGAAAIFFALHLRGWALQQWPSLQRRAAAHPAVAVAAEGVQTRSENAHLLPETQFATVPVAPSLLKEVYYFVHDFFVSLAPGMEEHLYNRERAPIRAAVGGRAPPVAAVAGM
ncbi:hypothetical protein BJ741DRAFT_609130 [Chytriomyces cf. hyalinus JEL632]|nr:hypothetical protein BJ741DRAFT_609130 [Chytriomyces cf. hyalinus JEL632]